eukprot:TRINITY_DN671_c0_g4_i1.p1 TRINITY_DN671_c0_g4~~TRINITY_DN671_c0_g4_i1.p1  ORF type:complete len:344 (+),score=69.86 TRINITY_DN671_c0_g4_i1:311-1342(+)
MIRFSSLNEKATTKNACVANIEKGLGEMWRKKARRQCIPTAEEIFHGKPTDKLWLFLKEIYDIFGMHDVEIWLKYVINQWASPILEMYGLEFSKESTEPPYIGLYEDMKDGQILFALIHYFSNKNEKTKFTELHTSPETRAELLENLKTVFELGKRAELPIWWTAEEFLANPVLNLDFVKQQLYYIYRKLKDANELSVITDKSECKDESLSPVAEKSDNIPQGLFSQLITAKPSALSLKLSALKLQPTNTAKVEQYLTERARMTREETHRIQNKLIPSRKDSLKQTKEDSILEGKVEDAIHQINDAEERSPEKGEAIDMKCPFSEHSEEEQTNPNESHSTSLH